MGHEVIITHVVPAIQRREPNGNEVFEPAHTRIYRFELEDGQQDPEALINAILTSLSVASGGVGGVMINEPETFMTPFEPRVD